MRKIYQKAIIMLSVACMRYATPAFAADAVVKTNKAWLSGATHIYGRMTVSGITSSNIKEKGFCYSSVNQMPTVEDGTSKSYLSNQGEIYNISQLKPATVYYIRAYVKQTSGNVVYGDPVKAITRPKGGVTYNINDGFPSDALTRVQSAAKEAIDLWNEYTGIHGLHITINYGAQTQTADCSYGGWMRIGPNASYQKTGTLLHEMLHAIGVGTHGTWQNSFLRSNTTSGYWLGVRATRALRFLDNSTTVRLNGDGTHMWPYGVNGAHEDNGTQILYVGNSLLAEALGEDGLAPTSSQFATPAYVFEQDDQQKYYLKNEGYGLGSKFLRVDKSGNLQWMSMSDEDATTNDSVAWNITFDPATCYYSLKNVATGKYLSYNSTGTNGIKTKEVTEVTDRERFHFLPSSVEVDKVGGEMRTGYWIAHVQNNSAYCLTAQKTNATTSANLKFSQEAGDQRWLILTADEAKELSQNYRNGVADELNALIENVEALLAVPHQETVEGADATFEGVLVEMKELAKTGLADELEQAKTDLLKAVKTFLGGVQAKEADKPFDISFLIQNGGMDALAGWTVSPEPTLNYSCAEYYEKSLDISQKLASMPKGVYEMKVQAFQRPGTTTQVNTDYAAGIDKVATYIYMGTEKNKQNICNIMADAQTRKLNIGKEAAAGTKYVPDDMQSAHAYFEKGLYENTLKYTTKYKLTITIGLKGDNVLSNYWAIFDNFRLYYYGEKEPVASGIQEIKMENPAAKQGVYTLGGQKVKEQAEDLQDLPQGIYIIDGKKVVVK